jgi:hypothetical protein
MSARSGPAGDFADILALLDSPDSEDLTASKPSAA